MKEKPGQRGWHNAIANRHTWSDEELDGCRKACTGPRNKEVSGFCAIQSSALQYSARFTIHCPQKKQCWSGSCQANNSCSASSYVGATSLSLKYRGEVRLLGRDDFEETLERVFLNSSLSTETAASLAETAAFKKTV